MGLLKCVVLSHAMAVAGMSYTLAADDGLIRYYANAPAGTITTIEIASSILFRTPRIVTAQPLTIDNVLDVLQKYDIKTLFLFPFNIAALSQRLLTGGSYDLSKLRTIISAGSPLSNATRDILKKSLPNVEIGLKYGLTEVGVISCTNANTKNGSVGYLMPGMTGKVGIRNNNTIFSNL